MIRAPRKSLGRRLQAGFTLIEIEIAIAISTLLLVALLPSQIVQAKDTVADVTGSQIFALSQASEAYLTAQGTWPTQTANCANFANFITALQGNGSTIPNYIGNFPSTPAAGGAFTISCTPQLLTISVDFQDANLAQYEASKLPVASVSGTVLTTSYTALLVPLLENVLYRVVVPGHPELNQMETAIDMNSNNINNGGQITSNAAGSAFLANNGYFESTEGPTSSTGVPAFLATQGQFQSQQTDVTTPAFYATGSYFESGNSGLGFYAPVGQFNSNLFNPSVPAFYAQRGYFESDVVNPSTPAFLAAHSGFDSYAGGGVNAFYAPNANLALDHGTVTAGSTGNAINAPNGNMTWGASGNLLQNDQGGSIELGGNNSTANSVSGGTPYIDFHYGNGSATDYDSRLVDAAAGQLTAYTGTLYVAPNANTGGLGNIVAEGQIASDTDVVAASKCFNGGNPCGSYTAGYSGTFRGLSQAVQDAFIIDPQASTGSAVVPAPTCPSGMNQEIFTAVSQVANGPNANALYQILTYATPSGPAPFASWTVTMTVVTDDGNGEETPPSGYGRVLAITKCT